MQSKFCPTCNAELETRVSVHPLTNREFVILEVCKPCAELRRIAAESNRMALIVPKLLRESNIPQVMIDGALSLSNNVVIDKNNMSAFELLTRWIEPGAGINAMICGTTGSGKTTLALAALLDVIRTGRGGMFVSEAHLEADMRKGWSRDLCQRAWESPMLVLDDLASRPLTDGLMTVYRDLLDERGINRRPVLITSQKHADPSKPGSIWDHWKVGNQLREDVSGRLVAMIGGNVAECTGPNRRLSNGH